ncbi:hypothetical protein [Dyella sp. C11]|uniref:hypothetical protein n=1 Tax=Dyella sp. C11 TaxID=2126991 RepID=UPI000D657BE4|nr:hypothetical protein [Dyella sp. C11]
MKPCVTVMGLLLALAHVGGVDATSLQPNPLIIKQISGVPAACLPEGKLKSIELARAYVMEDSLQGGAIERQWAIELRPGAKPLTLHPGECVGFGQPIDGYRETGTFKLLEAGRTYVFGINRGDQLDRWVSDSYVGVFCVQRLTDGHLTYLPYVDHPDGTTTYPTCGRYIGSPPAPDGIDPPHR